MAVNLKLTTFFESKSLKNVSNINQKDIFHRYGKNNLSKKINLSTVYVTQADVRNDIEPQSGCIFS
jgi:hypothetical protein